MRIYKSKRRVRVGDCDSKGRLRVDAIARYLQDIGYDDTNDLGLGDGGRWVARSIEIENLAKDSKLWPIRNEIVSLETFCGGIGKVIAQRNVDIFLSDKKSIQTKTLWVSLDENYKPTVVPSWLKQTYPEAFNVSSKRLLATQVTEKELQSIISFQFNLRQSDIDINLHANNSFAFDVLFEASQLCGYENFSRTYIEYHAAIDLDDEVTVLVSKDETGFAAWIKASNDVACSMIWEN